MIADERGHSRASDTVDTMSAKLANSRCSPQTLKFKLKPKMLIEAAHARAAKAQAEIISVHAEPRISGTTWP